METPLIILWLLFMAMILQVFSGTLILLTNKTRLEGIWYSIYLLSLGGWTLGIFFYYWLSQDYTESILFWVKFLYFFGVFSAISFFLFTYRFIQRKVLVWKLILFLSWGLTLGFFIFSGDSVVKSITFEGMNRQVIHGDLYFLFFITFFSFYIAGFYILIDTYKKVSISIKKQQVKYILISSIPVVGMASVLNMILPALWGDFTYAWLSPLYLLFEAFFIYYSIYRYRFLDIKLTLLRTMKNVLAFLVAIFLSALILTWFREVKNFNFLGSNTFFIEGALTLIFYFQMIWFFDSRFMEGVFGEKSFYRFRIFIDEYRNANYIYDSIDSLRKSLFVLFCEKLEINFMRLLILDEYNTIKYRTVLDYFKDNNNDVLVIEELPYAEMKYHTKFKVSKDFPRKGEVFIPLSVPNKGVVGILILGKKKRAIYLEREIKTLQTFGHYLSLILTGILYNEDLKDEVKRKTKQLAEKNRKLKKSYKKLKVFDEAKDDFMAIASHELRTPMTVIKGYTDLLLSESFGRLNKRQKNFTSYIQESSNDLLLLINDMLDLSKIESGQMGIHYEKMKVSHFLDFLQHSFFMECQKQGIEFQVVTGKNLPQYIIVDAQKIRLIMTNLIGNSIKFTPKGGRITVLIFWIGSYVQFEIKDTGIGIERNDLECIFDKFFQVKGVLNKTYKGTGLGLSIVKKLIELLGGDITVKSEQGKGTQFMIRFPIKGVNV